MSEQQSPAGWYQVEGQWRYWDGVAWAQATGPGAWSPTPGFGVQYCRACGTALAPQALVCSNCGTPVVAAGPLVPAAPMILMTPKDSAVAVILSLVLPGLGHFYVGGDETNRGVALLLSYLGCWFLGFVLLIILIGFLLFPVALAIWVFGMIDANRAVNDYNARLGLR